MAVENQDLLAALAAAEAGKLDSLAPEQVARLEVFLNANPGAGAALAGQSPAPEPVLRIPAPTPTPSSWARVWGAIECATAIATARPSVLKLRFWRSAVGAAAVLALLVGFWSLQHATSQPEWPVAWATHIEINDLEVSDDATPLVLCTESEGSIPVIWVLEGGG
jgi:hypothetical protein